VSITDTITDQDVDEMQDLCREAARYLQSPVPWWTLGKAWNERRHDLIRRLRTKALDPTLQT